MEYIYDYLAFLAKAVTITVAVIAIIAAIVSAGSRRPKSDGGHLELRKLNEELEVPTPKDYGIEENKYFSLLPTMAQQALDSGSPGNNPRVPTPDQIVDLYKEVWA